MLRVLLMSRTAWQVTLYVNVDDPRALRAAALAANPGQARLLGRKSRPDVGACLRMLFDPGTSPDGCRILDSSTEGGDGLD